MADIRESFATLENVSSQEGVVLGARTEGQSAAGIQGSIGFSFKDAAGNVVLPQLNASGQIPVSLDASGDNLIARGQNAGSGTPVSIATITLATSKTYQSLEAVVSCFRDTLAQIIFNDNGSETILADLLVGPGQYTATLEMRNIEFQSGSTGTQQLILRANNVNALSTIRGTIAIKELP